MNVLGRVHIYAGGPTWASILCKLAAVLLQYALSRMSPEWSYAAIDEPKTSADTFVRPKHSTDVFVGPVS